MKPRPAKTYQRPRFVEFGSHDTSRNLPRMPARKSSELDFLRQFERCYIAEALGIAIAGREFALEGFGRADLLWLAWTAGAASTEFTALALKKRVRLTAIEAKLSDWRKGLQQAFRYRYFAHRSFLVLPMATASIAARFLATFRKLRVGLWGFDVQTGRLRKWFTPRCARPISSKALQKALHVIESSLELSQSPKSP
jgi:hypothetical protein